MHDLPDDFDRWPSDPYALLGVTPGTPARAIRKAYTELIRHFKPERTPEHFRRIREAYDSVQRSEQWRAFMPPPVEPKPPEPPIPPIEDVSAAVPPETPYPLPDLNLDDSPMNLDEIIHGRWTPPPRPPDPDGDAVWDDACTGGHDRVYRQLREQIQRGGAAESVYLRLYWLRVAFPEVDLDIRPIDWAIRAIAAGFEHGRAHEILHAELLYRRELCRDAALVQMCERVQNADAVVRLYELRWRAALEYGQWSLVLDELVKARERLFDHPPQMVNLLSWLLGYMAWSGEDHVLRAFVKCRKELENLAGGNRNLDYLMERIDFLSELADQWREFQGVTRPLSRTIRDLVPLSWTGTSGQLRWRIYELYQEIVQNGDFALGALDVLAQSSPLVLAQVVVTAQQTYFPSRGNFRAKPEDIQNLVKALREFFTSSSPMRVDMLGFFAREQITVDDLLNQVNFREVSEPVQNLLTQLMADNPLRLVNLAQIALAG